MELLIYNGYQGSVETSVADNVLHGKVLFISDLVTYEAETLAQLKQAFNDAVNDYIETCQSAGKKPEKPLSGQFNVRVGEDLHKRALIRAVTEDKSLNAVVVDALEDHLGDASVRNHVHTHQHQVTVKLEHAWTTGMSPMQYIHSSSTPHEHATH